MTPASTRDVFRALQAERTVLRSRDALTLEEQVSLAQIPSPTGGEAERAGLLAERLRAPGRRVTIDDAGNVVALVPGTRDEAPVVVCAHMDTVFAGDTPLTVRRAGSILRGPGISDNARGLAAMLALSDALRAEQRRTMRPIILAATTGEEGDGDLRGARHLFDHHARDAHAAIALDGAGDDRVVSHALGCARLRVTMRGPGGHSWAAFGSPNPVHAIGALIARLTALPLPTSPRSTLTVGRVAGGTAINAIPRDAWIDVDIRSTSADVLQRLVQEVERSARQALQVENLARVSGSTELELTLTSIGERPGGTVDESAPLVRAACDATRAVNRVPQLAVASTDANVPISLGIPAIAIGAGGHAGQTHTPDEWFDATEAHVGVARALTIVVSAAGLA
jgi:acetylornithine deacetylase/succinyl-diaminopimelate desuccinylase-like protein